MTLEVGGDAACWTPGTDVIKMPAHAQFEEQADWWRVYLHEFTHATGHPTRLARAQSTRFGSREYAFEELVAEFGSAILAQTFEVSVAESGGLETAHALDHAAYLKSWIRLLEDDSRVLFDAWALALEACDWLEGVLASNEQVRAA